MKIENGILLKVTNLDIVNGEFIIPDSIIEIANDAFAYCHYLKSIIVPNSINKIGDYAFFNCYNLESIIIPNSITEIGDGTFANCYSLESIIIPNSVNKIGDYAFSNCDNLTSISISNSIIKIGNYAFLDCNNLESININEGNKYYSSENGVLFNKNKAKLIKYPQGKQDKKYIIPNSVNEIADASFSNCKNLTSIVIPDSVAKIENGAFSNCDRLKLISIPNSVIEIGDGAFWDCEKLQSKFGNYKAFNKGLVCNNMQYKPNEWNTVEGKIYVCHWGLHYVTNLFDIFNYYAGNLEKDIEIWEVEVGDIIVGNYDDSKKATNKIKPIKKLTREEIISILNNK